MRVAIETRSLRPPRTGIGHFVLRLTAAMLPQLAPDEELLSFNGWRTEPLDREFLARAEVLNAGAEPMRAPRLFRALTQKGNAFLRDQYVVRRGARMLQAGFLRTAEPRFDIFHAVNSVPPGVVRKPILPVIYDLSHLRFPQTHPKERIDWLEKRLKSLAAMPLVQTISEFSKSEIAEVLDIPAARIHVTYPAPGADFRLERDADESRLSRFNVEPCKYLLVVGTREPRKNFKTVADAYTALPASVQSRFPLLWVGPSGWGDLSLSPAVERAKLSGRIRVTGYVPDRDLAALYRNTALFVMPSIYEGFGMPVVEAMACGAAIALSKIPVFEEIARNAARYVDPMDVAGWRQALSDAIEDAAELPGRARDQDLTRFSWHSSAATTLDLYRRLARA